MPNPRVSFEGYLQCQGKRSAATTESTEAEFLFGEKRSAALSVDSGQISRFGDSTIELPSPTSWQSWLVQWEARQHLQLQHHEHVMRDLVETLNKTLVERQGEPKKSSKESVPLVSCLVKEHQVKDSALKEGPSSCPNLAPSLAFADVIASNASNASPNKDASVSRAASKNSRQDVRVGFHQDFEKGNMSNVPSVSSLPGPLLPNGLPVPAYQSQASSAARTAAAESLRSGSKGRGWRGFSMASMASFAVGPEPTMASFRRASVAGGKRVFRPANPLQAHLFALVSSRYFAWASSMLIGLYALAVGVMADVEMRTAVVDEESPIWVWYIDVGFSILFALEVILRLAAEGRYYFLCPERNWNIFDVIVALVGLSDMALASQVNLGFLRVCRALRAVRVLRFLRTFPIFRELRMMAESICCCAVSLGWAMVLMGSVMYFFSIVLLRGASDTVRARSLTPEAQKTLTHDFGSLPKTVFSLTQAVSGGRSWGEYADPFVQVSYFFAACFPVFIMFVVFGALNILTGIFVESTSSIANYDRELAVEEEMSRIDAVAGQIRQFFDELDEDNSGTISFEELEKSLEDDRVKAYFSILQMDFKDAQDLFKLLDQDHSGEIEIEEFIVNCMWLKGSARNIDLATVLKEAQRLHRSVKNLQRTVNNNLHELRQTLDKSGS